MMKQSLEITQLSLRKAQPGDVEAIWSIFEDAIQKRKAEGSQQWQDGYPNIGVVEEDIVRGSGYVSEDAEGQIYGYLALIFEKEPAYEIIEGTWLSDQPYAVVHRIAVSQTQYIKGQATWMMLEVEKICIEKGYYSIRVDTNFDNTGMLRVFEKLGFEVCGQVYFRGGARRAFEKILQK